MKIKKYLETNDNENLITQNLRGAVKAGLRGKFITTQAYFKKQEKQQINNLTLNLKQLENEAQKNPQKKHRKMKHTKKNVRAGGEGDNRG